jgi:multimeric flavodoxin WrbA
LGQFLDDFANQIRPRWRGVVSGRLAARRQYTIGLKRLAILQDNLHGLRTVTVWAVERKVPYSASGQMRLEELTGGTPYGATTISGPDNKRQPSANEVELATFQGKHVAEVPSRQRLSLEAVKTLG